MTFVRMAFFPEGRANHYAAVRDALAEAPSPPERLLFAAGPRDGGWQVVQVWRDAASLQDFNEHWLAPALAALGSAAFPRPPVVIDFEAVDFDLGQP